MSAGSVSGYQLWGRLSHGGMSDVWLARHAELAFPVIIKTMKHGGAGDEDPYHRLLSEARMMARVTSPQVVRLIDIGRGGGPGDDTGRAPYLVEEYVDGIDLSELDRRRREVLRRPLPLWMVADYVAEAAAGLHAAHQAGVIHRDVKPSNLFGYGHGHVKLGDFGVAMATSEAVVPGGTPLYMAPEQLTHGGRVDRRCDVYGLGATAYALRYGSPPFQSLGEITRSEVPIFFPPARSPEEAYFQHVLSKMMSRRVEHRYRHLTTPRHQFLSIARATTPTARPSQEAPGVFRIGATRVVIEVGDLPRTDVQAIVNSAESAMKMQSGVGAAIRLAGGDAIEAEAIAGGDRALGDCVLTSAGTLPYRGIIHAVAAWNEVSCIARTTHRALLLAEEHGFKRIAFPALGTGRSRVALEASVDALIGALRLHLLMGGSGLEEVRLVLLDGTSHARANEVATAVLVGTDDSAQFGDEADAPPERCDTEADTMFGSTPAGRTGPPTGTHSG